MKRVTIVSGDFVRTGGMDMPNFALARHLADRGVTVHLVAYRVAEELASHPNVRWHRVQKPFNSYLLGGPILDFVGRRVAGAESAAGSRVVVNGGNCQVGDVNWVHYVHAAYEPSRPKSTLRLAKAAATRRLELTLERKALRSARLVIVNSERTRRDLTTLLGVDDARIHTIYYGIDAARFAPPTEDRIRQLREGFGWGQRRQVAFLGALGDRRKGFDTLYAAWSNLCKTSTWDCDLVVVGHGVELREWQDRTRADGLADRIRFLGFRRDVPDILAACDALVAPTRYEAFGLGVQEALCTGLPALASADAGVAERYPNALSGMLLTDPDSAHELEARLNGWRQNALELRRATHELSRALRQRSWDDMAGEIGALLQ